MFRRRIFICEPGAGDQADRSVAATPDPATILAFAAPPSLICRINLDPPHRVAPDVVAPDRPGSGVASPERVEAPAPLATPPAGLAAPPDAAPMPLLPRPRSRSPARSRRAARDAPSLPSPPRRRLRRASARARSPSSATLAPAPASPHAGLRRSSCCRSSSATGLPSPEP
ncbi:predicted GPI-anchored protein 58 [Eucalyptus grandis]|uniref:predicted GPI-anchored protein 58 n=1 Tax=Eucalyptus grandis TaxID=71139 RepID=UPI00192E7B01|nr:predicted GPI-anchored protein 58 [Eucalyptus grandis]